MIYDMPVPEMRRQNAVGPLPYTGRRNQRQVPGVQDPLLDIQGILRQEGREKRGQSPLLLLQ